MKITQIKINENNQMNNKITKSKKWQFQMITNMNNANHNYNNNNNKYIKIKNEIIIKNEKHKSGKS